MSWNATLYSQNPPPLTLSEIEGLAPEGASITPADNGTHVVSWPDGGSLRLFPPMPEEKLPGHLNGLMGFVVHHSGGDINDGNRGLLQFFSSVKTASACLIEESGPNHEAESLLISMACTYAECMIFAHNSLYSPFGQCIFGPDDQPLVDLARLKVRRGRMEPPQQTEAQARRQAKMQARLNEFQVPAFGRPIGWIPDDDEAELRTAEEVAKRLLAMHGTVCYARGMNREQALAHIGECQLTPQESQLFQGDEPDPEQAQSLIWRIEALVVLMWALGLNERLAWPDSMCDVEGVHQRIFAATHDTAAFVRQARLRPKAEILDELELITRLHWALRNCHIKSEPVPENLNWGSSAPRIAVSHSPLPLVVGQRHQALNWLISFNDDDWDNVDTPT